MLDRFQSVLPACQDLAAAAGDAAAVAGEVAGYVVDEGIAAARAKIGSLDDNAGTDDGDSLAAVTDLGPARSRRRVWSRAGHAAIEVRGLLAGQDRANGHDSRQLADAVRRALSRLHGDVIVLRSGDVAPADARARHAARRPAARGTLSRRGRRGGGSS